MSCENCEKEDEIIKKFEEFGDKLRELIDEYNLEVHSSAIASQLIQEAKIEMFCTSPCLYHMVGLLNCMLHHHIEDIWEEMKPRPEDEEETNAPSTL